MKLSTLLRLTSFDRRTLLAQDNDFSAHAFSSLLDGEASFFVDVDDGDCSVHASSTRHGCDDRPRNGLYIQKKKKNIYLNIFF